MLLKLYKSNQPFVLLFLPLLALVFWIKSYIHPLDLSSYHYSLFSDRYNFLQIKFEWLNTTIALVMVFLGAVLLNSIANKQKFMDKENYLPAFFYVLFNSFYVGQLFLTPVLLANIFLLLSLQRFLNMYRQNIVFSECFDSGFLLAIAVVFYLPYLFLLPLIYIGLIIIRSFSWREWVLPLLGFLCVFFLVFVWFFVFDLRLKPIMFDRPNIFLPLSLSHYPWVGYSFLIFSSIIVLLSFGALIPQYGKSSVQEKNAKLIFIWLLFFMLGIFFIAG